MKTTIDTETRRAICEEYRQSTMDQDHFCAHLEARGLRVRARTLRSWLRALEPQAAGAIADLDAIVERVVRRLLRDYDLQPRATAQQARLAMLPAVARDEPLPGKAAPIIVQVPAAAAVAGVSVSPAPSAGQAVPVPAPSPNDPFRFLPSGRF